MDSTKNVLRIASIARVLVAEASVELVKGVGTFSTALFPGGWCQDTSRALGHLLADQNERGFELIFGKRPYDEQNTHVWLERDGLIVDITADQFEESGCPGVMVTTDRRWHDGWVQNRHELDEVQPGHADAAIYNAVSGHPDWHAMLNASAMDLPKIYCNSISYRSGFVEVCPNIHPGHINIEIWNLHPDHNTRYDVSDELKLECKVTGNTEIELNLDQARELVRLLGLSIDACTNVDRKDSSQVGGIDANTHNLI